jgi:cytoskeleton protein RodZ
MSDTLQNDTSAAPAARLGGELRARRQSLGWELPDLAQSLRIRQPYLEAIEGGRMSELPGSTYALGFVRAYASALGLQGEQVASRFRAESAVANIRPALSFPAPVPQRGVPAGALMLLGLVILGGAYGGWYYMSEHQHTPAETVPPIPDHLLPAAEKPAPSPQVASILPTASAPAPAPVVTPAPAAPVPAPVAGPAAAQQAAVVPRVSLEPAQPAPAVSTATIPPASAAGVTPAAAAPGTPAAPGAAPVPAGTRIVLKTNGNAWVTVKQPGGPAIYNKLMHAGDTWPVPADKAGLSLTTGNAGATELDVDGTAIPNLGGSGAVRRDLKLDADALKSGPLPPITRGHAPKPAE